MRKRYKRKNDLMLLLLIIITLGIGYALISTNITINGIGKFNNQNWDVHFEDLTLNPGNVELSSGDVAASINQTTMTDITFTVTLQEPGDFYEFEVAAVNAGTMDAMIGLVTNNLNGSPISETNPIPTYARYTATYSDGIAFAPNHLLEAGYSETYKVRVEYRTDINPEDLPEQVEELSFSFGVQFLQADTNSIHRPLAPKSCTEFTNDSWNTIVTNVKNGITYEVGCTKEVELGNDLGIHTLRVANTSTPAECSTANFSQTACGFVLEFADCITTHRMNLSNPKDTTIIGANSKGGWEYSDMRAYLNSKTYAYENIDYSTTGIYSSLPEVLRNAIIDTTVVSGHNNNDTTNFITKDKIYLLSTKEVWGKEGTSDVIYYDTAEIETRQLDYYQSQGVTTDSENREPARKPEGYYLFWWLRTAASNSDRIFFTVDYLGGLGTNYSNGGNGVAPAFRIAGLESNLVTMTYNLQDGSSTSDSTVDTPKGLSINLLTPTRIGYAFNGWYTESSGGTKIGDGGESYIPTADITLYAHWTDLCTNFANDSWSTIVSNVQNGNTTRYPVGCTKPVELGNSLGTHTLRVANTSTPAECGTTGFSETACGFVLEFADVITTHRMNPSDDDSDTAMGINAKGGWEYSDMRAYLNSTTYAYENINYATTGIYSSLPEVLRNAVINTTVVSGHSSGDTTNFTTTDKLYLLSTHEVWEDNDGNTITGIDYHDTAYNNTRQLDYYQALRVTASNYSGAIKQTNDSNYSWWLRSADLDDDYYFYLVNGKGRSTSDDSDSALGASPAFRIA